jgi:tagatose-6-phosphate ketose/aldose isomerase
MLVSTGEQERPLLSPRLAQLAAASEGEQRRLGYFHTLAEICQQPSTWRTTTATLAGQAERLAGFLRAAGLTGDPAGNPGNGLHAGAPAGGAPGRGLGIIVLTGSGSSQYVGDSLALPLQEALHVPVQTVASGSILTNADQVVPADLPCLVISFARSGDSPESGAALDLLLDRRPASHHLIITCNGRGRLATSRLDDPRVRHIVLDDRTCDRSLVMTSSFTNMVLAGRFLAALDSPAALSADAAAGETLARAATHLLAHDADRLAVLAARPFNSVVFLASAARTGAAREAALKLTEMTEGRVRTLSETFLGLRHGPMSTVHADTLIVAFLSSDATTRAYELDLLRELDRKRLGAGKLIVGAQVSAESSADAIRAGDTIVEYADASALPDDRLVVLDVLVAQLLAFFRCLGMGFKPDAPSSEGVINRVVEKFAIHGGVNSESGP